MFGRQRKITDSLIDIKTLASTHAASRIETYKGFFSLILNVHYVNILTFLTTFVYLFDTVKYIFIIYKKKNPRQNPKSPPPPPTFIAVSPALNLRAVMAFTEIGKGHSGLETFCGYMKNAAKEVRLKYWMIVMKMQHAILQYHVMDHGNDVDMPH